MAECVLYSMKMNGVPANKTVKKDFPGEIQNYCSTHQCPDNGSIIEHDGFYENGMSMRAGIVPRECWTNMMGEEIERHPIGSPGGPKKRFRKG